ncbi:MAG: glycoside hydrolase [Chitinophagaceae bacterium]|nr:glycoside hydrolase [Chitinophagaceae bacterium]
MYMSRQKRTYVKEGLTFLAFIFITSYLTFSWYHSSVRNNSRPATYDKFGIYIPQNFSIHGIDVSKYQQNVHWTSVKEMKVDDVQLGFAFIKATQGTDRTDPSFNRNWTEAKETGIARGAYHFYNPTQSGKYQARHFIRTVGPLAAGDLPPVLDIEVTKGANTKKLRKELLIWLKEVEAHYKVKPHLYNNAGFYHSYLGKEFDSYQLWVAHYKEPVQPRINRDWIFWQHSDRGRVNGIAAAVDFNVFNGDSAAFNALLLK